MHVGKFLEDIGQLGPDWDEQLECSSCGAPILELHSRGAPGPMLAIERVQWSDGHPARQDDDIVCPQCGCRSPVGHPHIREPLPV
jgi:hypothetical protein